LDRINVPRLNEELAKSVGAKKCFLPISRDLSPFLGGFICTFSLLISLSIILQTSKFWNQFTIF
jgi:hypothetical protein